MIQTANGLRIGPERTPSLVKNLIILTSLISIGSAFVTGILRYIFGMNGPQEWLSLSWWGLQNLFLWQPLTYLFVHPIDGSGISFSFLILLAFNMYILWMMGSELIARMGAPSFARLYFFCGITSGILSLLLMPVFSQYSVIAGPSAAILAVMTVWAFLNPDREILLFFLIPIKSLWLIIGVLFAILLVNLSQFNFIYCFFYLSGALLGYFYALIAWGIHSPFIQLYKFELAVIRQFQRFKPKQKSTGHKIYNFATGEPELEDSVFIDAMLEKISKKGESALTSQERKRMDEISKKKSKK